MESCRQDGGQNQTPNTITVTPDADPASEQLEPGAGYADPVPTPTPTNQGYGAECRWDLTSLNLIPGHQYRLYFMVHDGDQNNTGGDVGQDCVFFTMPGSCPTANPNPDCVSYSNGYANRDTGDDRRRWQDVRRKDGQGLVPEQYGSEPSAYGAVHHLAADY